MHTYAMADASGAILQIVSGPYRYVRCDADIDDSTHYVEKNSDVIRLKSELEDSHRVTGLTVVFTDLPEGLSVKTNSMETVTDGEPLEITYDVPGTYTVTMAGRVEYLDHETEVTVDDP